MNVRLEKNKSFQCVDKRSFETVYYDLSRTEYSLEELRARPLPHGVDPSRIEQYLSDATFKVFILMDNNKANKSQNDLFYIGSEN